MKIVEKGSWIIVITFVFCMFYKPVFCVILFGLIGVYYTVYFLILMNDIYKNGKEIVGKIISWERDDNGGKVFLIEYEVNGKTLVNRPCYYTSTDFSEFKNFQTDLNKSVAILCSLKKPEKFVIKSARGFNYFSLVFLSIVSLLFLFLGFASLFNCISIDGW